MSEIEKNGNAPQQEAPLAETKEIRARESAAGYISEFLEDLRARREFEAVSTGLKGLDDLLDGGLYPGLYVIGAITSLGKTTFILQIADFIAASGHDVLCFNMEMSKKELIARSVSRISYQLRRGKKAARKGLSTRDIMSSQKWEAFTDEDMALMSSALDQYSATSAPHMWHFEGIGDIGVLRIREEVEKHVRIMGRVPVVFVDYLQILASPDPRLSDKQAVDKNVLELKRLSRDKGCPVVCISSLNRNNYSEPINHAAFKESGAVEYSSDCLIGLQFQGMDYRDSEENKDRLLRIRKLMREQKALGNEGKAEAIELKVLKNRNGRAGTSETLDYTPVFNHYEETFYEKVDARESGALGAFRTERKIRPL